MVESPADCKEKMIVLLDCLVDERRVTKEDAGNILVEFGTFLSENQDVGNFDKKEDRLDIYLQSGMSNTYQKLWSVVRKLLLLSHGQACVERGFSENKQLCVENQGENSLIARRLVKDFIRSSGGGWRILYSPGHC